MDIATLSTQKLSYALHDNMQRAQDLMPALHIKQTAFDVEYEMQWGNVAGVGASGSVRRCRHIQSNQLYAIKILPFSLEALKEIEAWRMCSPHPNIANLVDVFDTGILFYGNPLLFSLLCPGRYLFMVMENLTGGNLVDLIRSKKLDERSCSTIVAQILHALEHIHAHNYVHGDVKLDNVVLVANDSLEIRLLDFGFARQSAVPVGKYYSLLYTAPELFESFDYFTEYHQFLPVGASCDMWAVGVISFMLLTGSKPFFAQSTEAQAGGRDNKTITPYLRKCVGEGRFATPTLWWQLSQDARNFVESVLVVDPPQRPSATLASTHPWLGLGQAARLLLGPLGSVASVEVPVDIVQYDT